MIHEVAHNLAKLRHQIQQVPHDVIKYRTGQNRRTGQTTDQKTTRRSPPLVNNSQTKRKCPNALHTLAISFLRKRCPPRHWRLTEQYVGK